MNRQGTHVGLVYSSPSRIDATAILVASGMLGTDLQAMLCDGEVAPFGRVDLEVIDLDAVQLAVVRR